MVVLATAACRGLVAGEALDENPEGAGGGQGGDGYEVRQELRDHGQFPMPWNRPAKPMKAMERMPAMKKLIARPRTTLGHVGELVLFAQAGHDHQRQRQADAGAQGVDQALDQVVAAVGREQRQAEDRAVGGDQRQEDAQRLEQRGAELLDHHLHELHRAGDDHDEADQPQVGRVGQDEAVQEPGRQRGDDHHEDVGQAQPERGVQAAR